uniref:YbjN domain-containing protein n=1 Tax=Thermus caliditerrae TaxID=1330700 RepID=A0A7C5RE15_9DEIN
MNGQMEPLSQERIDRHLKRMGLKVLKNPEDGQSLVLLKEDTRATALVVVAAEGSDSHILSVIAKIENVPPLGTEELLKRANDWNNEHRWPRAFVGEGGLYADFHVDLEKGVSEEQLRNFLLTAFLSLSRLLRWLEGMGEPDLVQLLRLLGLREE